MVWGMNCLALKVNGSKCPWLSWSRVIGWANIYFGGQISRKYSFEFTKNKLSARWRSKLYKMINHYFYLKLFLKNAF